MFRNKPIPVLIIILALIPVAVIGWWLASPLFISRTVEESFPLSTNAVVPEGMTQAEVEQVMSGMAKVSTEMKEEMPGDMQAAEVVKTGSFHDGDDFHKGSGQATIYRQPDGSTILRLENLSVTNGPDLHVLLSGNADPTNRDQVMAQGYIDLGKLKGNIGDQNYEIPPDVDLASFNSVVIYCKPFHVVFSVAPFQ